MVRRIGRDSPYLYRTLGGRVFVMSWTLDRNVPRMATVSKRTVTVVRDVTPPTVTLLGGPAGGSIRTRESKVVISGPARDEGGAEVMR